jgi:hypothetical protein
MLERNTHILLSAMLASAFACVLPDGENEGFMEEDEIAESALQDLEEDVILKDISSADLSAESIRLRSSHKIHYGGTFLEEDHYHTVGGMCSAGATRVSPPTVWHAGHGWCKFKEWLDPYNSNDCRARIHVHHSAGWLYGDCYIDIFENYPDLYRTDLSGSAGSWRHYTVSVPSGRSKLVARITGGSGDADLYVRYGAQPTETAWTCRPYLNGNEETCSINNPSAGTWYVSIRGYSSYSGVTLTAAHN